MTTTADDQDDPFAERPKRSYFVWVLYHLVGLANVFVWLVVAVVPFLLTGFFEGMCRKPHDGSSTIWPVVFGAGLATLCAVVAYVWGLRRGKLFAPSLLIVTGLLCGVAVAAFGLSMAMAVAYLVTISCA